MRLLISLLIATFAPLGCSSHITTIVNPIPQKSFVKILKNVEIKKCHKKSKICKPGAFASTGSGSVVFKDKKFSYILTAAHVCNTDIVKEALNEIKEFEISVYIVIHNKKIHEAKILHSNDLSSGADLCLLTVAPLDITPLKLSIKEPVIGARLFCMAAPIGIYHPPTVPIFDGIYSGLMPDNINFLSTIPAAGGSSGAPVLNYKMELIGVLFATHPNFKHVSISSSHESTKNFLLKHLKL